MASSRKLRYTIGVAALAAGLTLGQFGFLARSADAKSPQGVTVVERHGADDPPGDDNGGGRGGKGRGGADDGAGHTKLKGAEDETRRGADDPPGDNNGGGRGGSGGGSGSGGADDPAGHQ